MLKIKVILHIKLFFKLKYLTTLHHWYSKNYQILKQTHDITNVLKFRLNFLLIKYIFLNFLKVKNYTAEK